MPGKRKPFKAILELPAEVRTEAENRLLRGEKAMAIGQWLKSLGHAIAASDTAAEKQIARYRAANLSHKVAKDFTQYLNRRAIRSPGHSAFEPVDVLEETTKLVRKQIKRVAKMQKLEDETPMLMGTVTTEMMNLHKMLQEVGSLYMEAGLLRRAPKKFEGTLGTTEGQGLRFEFSETVEALVDEAERELVDLIQGRDYQAVEGGGGMAS